MSVEQSYIDIFKQNCQTIVANSAEPLNGLRNQAFQAFCSAGFPNARHEDYQHSDMSALFAKDYGINLSQFDVTFNPYESFKCDIQNIKSHLLFVINDVFYDKSKQAQDTISALQSQGVVIGSLRKVAKSNPDLVARYFSKATGIGKNPIADFNTAFALDGLFLYVPKGCVLETPVQLINVMNSQVPLLANSRNIIVADDDSQLQIMICEHTGNELEYMSNRVYEVFANSNSNVQVYKLEDSSSNMHSLSNICAQQQQGAQLLVHDLTLQNGVTRNDVSVDFMGENCSLSLYGLVVADNQQKVDNHTFVNHALPRCSSNQLYKYILSGEAVGAFEGRVLVDKGAKKTEAYQSNKNIVSTSQAKMYTKPHLEIYADDVKCSHGAAVGQLDESALFYMRQRGIPETEARMLLMIAFGADVVDSIKIEALRQRMHMLVEHRFRGEASNCGTCGGCLQI